MQAHEFWQEIESDATIEPAEAGIAFHPARFEDGRLLRLPIRPLADGEHALASLILNQASFSVVETIAGDLASKLTPYEVDVIVGLPTLGLTLASAAAVRLGHSRYVPLGTSRKFWYREDLSVPLSSITTPDQQKRLYVDPRMAPLLQGRRIALIDDVISSGASMVAALELMRLCGNEPVVIAAAMLQSKRWRARLASLDPKWPARVVAALRTPLLARDEDGRWRRAAEKDID
jgi:adenine/guanine phosphoribosyltransferase-like PRPP-binding protein